MRKTFSLLLLLFLLAGCRATSTAEVPAASTQTPAEFAVESPAETQPAAEAGSPPSIEARLEELLAQMTLEEKIGQMTQVEKSSIRPGDITRYFIGSILSGGGGSPSINSAKSWAQMVDGFQKEALDTRLQIPLIYGVDAVHGHGNLKGATIFPQNIGLGAADDPDLMYRIGQATAEEMWATGIPWNFGPVVAVPQDIRWGRTYEGYSEDTALVSRLAAPYIQGLQAMPEGDDSAEIYTLATPKHFLGDGGTTWGTAATRNMGVQYQLDQGDMLLDEAQVRELFLPPYQAAVDAGAMSIMVSFSSWNGTKMHAQKYLLTDVLKGELGFEGFLISDWQAIDQIPGDYYSDVVTSVNAGLDMIMVPYDYVGFINNLKKAVEAGDVSMARIDDAVRRILKVKLMLGLFDHPYADETLLDSVGSEAHRELAREAVRKSLVLLKNENAALPIPKEGLTVYVAGQGAKDVGLQSGGWTIQWQGAPGAITPGTTILEGIQAAVAEGVTVEYDRSGEFEGTAEIGIVVVGEWPYAEGVGDMDNLTLSQTDIERIDNIRARVDKLVVVIVSGRPMVITDQLPLADAWVAAWLPGTEGEGVADVLFGDYAFTGKLPYSWPRANDQLPINIHNLGNQTGCDGPLFPFGYGLTTSDPSPEIAVCP